MKTSVDVLVVILGGLLVVSVATLLIVATRPPAAS